MSADRIAALKTISPMALHTICQGGKAVELIDVRTPAEYRQVHAAIARLVPLDTLNPGAIVSKRVLNKDEPLYVICRSGSRAQKACEAFAAAGFGDVVVNVEGGTLAWEQAGLPVEHGKKTIALERQVRIAAGGLVTLGCVLGTFVHPWLHALSGLIGLGLVFSGITDTCAMGMLIAKMPWNQVRQRPP